MQREKGQLLFSSAEGANSGTAEQVRSAREKVQEEQVIKQQQAVEEPEMFEIKVSELSEVQIEKYADEMMAYGRDESENKNQERARLKEQAKSLGIDVGKRFSKTSYRTALIDAIKSERLGLQETAEERTLRIQQNQQAESIETAAAPEPPAPEAPKEQMIRIGGTDEEPIYVAASKIRTRAKNSPTPAPAEVATARVEQPVEVTESARVENRAEEPESAKRDYSWITKTLEKAKSGVLDSRDLGPLRNALENPDLPEELFLPAYKALVTTWVINGGRRQKENIARFQASEPGKRYDQIIARQVAARRKNEPAPAPRESRGNNFTEEEVALRGLTMKDLREAFKDAREKRDTGRGLSVLSEAQRRYDKLIAKETNPREKHRLEFAKSEILADKQAIYDAVAEGNNEHRANHEREQATASHRRSDDNRRIEKDTKLTRDAAQITFARIPKYGENDAHPLWAETEAEGNKKFKEISIATWKEFALHGLARKKAGTDDYELIRSGDLDGRTALQLLEAADFDISQTEYIPKGESVKGKINIDTGDKEGLVIEDEGETAFFDHHAPESRGNNSATKIMYEVLTKMGFLEKNIKYDKIVDFVNKTDNMLYSAEDYGTKSARTMVGLRRSLTFRQMITLMKDYAPTDTIPDDVLKKMQMPRERGTLWDESEKRRKQMEQDLQRVEEMKSEGLVIDSADYGQIVVDIYGSLKTGADVAKASGAGAFIKWMPQTKSFFLSTFRIPLKDNHRFGEGTAVRDTMWIKPQGDGEALKTSLAEMVSTLTNGKAKPNGELKKYIDSPESYRLAVPEKEVRDTKGRVERMIQEAQAALTGDDQVKPGKLRSRVEQELAKLSSNTREVKTPALVKLAEQNRAELMAKVEAYERAYEREKVLREVAAEEWDNTFAEMLDERIKWGYTDQEISNYLASPEHAQFMTHKQEIINNTLVELRTL